MEFDGHGRLVRYRIRTRQSEPGTNDNRPTTDGIARYAGPRLRRSAARYAEYRAAWYRMGYRVRCRDRARRPADRLGGIWNHPVGRGWVARARWQALDGYSGAESGTVGSPCQRRAVAAGKIERAE